MIRLKQVGALPVRRGMTGSLEVLLITSRSSGRWVIPKGWTSKRLSDLRAAAREAKEEAGVHGRLTAAPIGRYCYVKNELGGGKSIDVDVYLLLVDKVSKHWEEEAERHRVWFTACAAAARVHESDLGALIRLVEHQSSLALLGKRHDPYFGLLSVDNS